MIQHSNFPKVYPILDSAALQRNGCGVVEAAQAILDGGARILQFRHKEFWSAGTIDLAARVAELCRSADVQFIVNDRADYAGLLGAGLHVGQDDLPLKAARAMIGPNATLGFSTHTLAQLLDVQFLDFSYAALGPIFQTSSKQNPDAVVGTALLSKARSLLEKPLVAIGGITLDSAPKVWEAGADSIAVIGSVLSAPCSLWEIQERTAAWIRLGQQF